MSYSNYNSYLANRAVCCCQSKGATGATGATGPAGPYLRIKLNGVYYKIQLLAD